MTGLVLRNRHLHRRVRLAPFRRALAAVGVRLSSGGKSPLPPLDLSVQVVGDEEMIRLNETHLRHAGVTDVITFDYGEARDRVGSGRRHGDIVVCLDEACRQAQRFGVAWEEELLRYMIHGLLHLVGYGDDTFGRRRAMKQVEGRLLREVAGGIVGRGNSEAAGAREGGAPQRKSKGRASTPKGRPSRLGA